MKRLYLEGRHFVVKHPLDDGAALLHEGQEGQRTCDVALRWHATRTARCAADGRCGGQCLVTAGVVYLRGTIVEGIERAEISLGIVMEVKSLEVAAPGAELVVRESAAGLLHCSDHFEHRVGGQGHALLRQVVECDDLVRDKFEQQILALIAASVQVATPRQVSEEEEEEEEEEEYERDCCVERRY